LVKEYTKARNLTFLAALATHQQLSRTVEGISNEENDDVDDGIHFDKNS